MFHRISEYEDISICALLCGGGGIVVDAPEKMGAEGPWPVDSSNPILLSPFAHPVQDRDEGSAPLCQAVFHLWGNLGIFLPVDKLIRLQLLQCGAEGLIGNTVDVPFHLVESNHTELHQSIQDGHFIFPADQGQGVAEARGT